LYRISRILLGVEKKWAEIGIHPNHEGSLRYLARAEIANTESHAIKVEHRQRTDKTSIEHQVLRRMYEKSLSDFKSSFNPRTTTEKEKSGIMKKYLTHPEIFTEKEQKWILKNCEKKAEASPSASTPLLESSKSTTKREASQIEMPVRGSSSYSPPPV
jgi:hypothetical protein